MIEKEEYNIGRDIVGAAYCVRKNTGRGLLEKFYENALAFELREMGYDIECQAPIPAIYRGNVIGDAYRADIVVNKKVIIEIKALSFMDNIECCQLYTYLWLSNFKLGYLINFGAINFELASINDNPPLDKGIYAIANNL